MDILARRLTIITLLLAIFAFLLAVAVETDYRRGEHSSALSACAVANPCRAAL